MRKWLCPLLFTSVALAGCDRQGNTVKDKPARPTVVEAVICAPPPALALSPDFEGDAFAPGSSAFKSTESNFAAAYRKSCENGLLRDAPLMDDKASDQDRIFLRNAPEANVTGIYLGGEDGDPQFARRMVLESTFVTEEGTNLPSIKDLEEAIFCHVKGATPQEQEETGRCLPD